MNKLGSISALLCAVVLSACEKTAVQDITGPLPSASIKFFNFGPGTPGVNFYANAAKMTAVSSTACTPTPTDTVAARVCRETGQESTTGVAYGAAASGGFYGAVEPGQYTITGRIAATTDKDLVVATAPATIEAGKKYSYYISGIYNTTAKTAEAFVVEDVLPAFDYGVAYVRFVNAISNSSPMTLYGTNTSTTPVSAEVAIGGVIAYKAAGAFVSLPAGVYNLATRTAGSGTNVMTRTAVSFSAGRVYTITARGNMTVASTQALDNTANR